MSNIVQLADGRAAEIVERWTETTVLRNGNFIGRYTRSEWRHVDLAHTKTGLWVTIPDSQYENEHPQPHEISPAEAAGWFAACELDIPDELVEEVA